MATSSDMSACTTLTEILVVANIIVRIMRDGALGSACSDALRRCVEINHGVNLPMHMCDWTMPLCSASVWPAEPPLQIPALKLLAAGNTPKPKTLEMTCGLPTRRYFQAIWSLKCPAGCQPAGTFKPFGLEMPCGLPTGSYFQAIWCLKCQAIWS